MNFHDVRESIRQQTYVSLWKKRFQFFDSLNKKISRRVKSNCDILFELMEITDPMEFKLNTYTND